MQRHRVETWHDRASCATEWKEKMWRPSSGGRASMGSTSSAAALDLSRSSRSIALRRTSACSLLASCAFLALFVCVCGVCACAVCAAIQALACTGGPWRPGR